VSAIARTTLAQRPRSVTQSHAHMADVETWIVIKRCVRRLPPDNELALLTVRQTATTGKLRVDVLVPRVNHLTTLKPGEADTFLQDVE